MPFTSGVSRPRNRFTQALSALWAKVKALFTR